MARWRPLAGARAPLRSRYHYDVNRSDHELSQFRHSTRLCGHETVEIS